MNADRWLKIIATISFILLTITLILAYRSPATGYEISIYRALAPPIWVFFVLAIFGGLTIIIYQATKLGEEKSRLWLLGLTVLIFAQIILLALPYVRGYVAFRGDNITHLGMVRDITTSGFFAGSNFYPGVHILLSSLSSITGIPEITVFNLGVAFLAPPVFFLSTYLLATITLPERRQQLLAMALAALIFPAVLVTPNGWSMLFLPLLFFCYFKRPARGYRVFLILILVLLPFLHPLTSFMIILALIVIEVVRTALIPVVKDKSVLNLTWFAFGPVFIEIIVFCTWVLSFTRFQASLRLFWDQVLNFAAPDVLADIGTRLGKMNIEGMGLLYLYFKLYGVTTVLIALSLVAVFFLCRRIRSHLNRATASLFLLSATFLFAGFLYLLYLLGFPGLSTLGGDRFLRYTLIFTPLFAGLGIYKIFKKLDFRIPAVIATTGVITLCAVLVVFTLYPSPYVIRPNPQVTDMDMKGMAWFIEEKDIDVNSIYIMSSPDRFADGIISKRASDERRDLKPLSQIPDHFTYNKYDTVGEQYVDDKYAVITRFDRIIYTTVWQIVGRFNNNDFDKLENDITVDRLYSNGELEVYLIHSSKS